MPEQEKALSLYILTVKHQSAFFNKQQANRALTALGKVSEILTMLPPDMRQTIHTLFTLMWATGVTPRAWKTSETVLVGKGKETNLPSYRPEGLANTLYKPWTRTVTSTLY